MNCIDALKKVVNYVDKKNKWNCGRWKTKMLLMWRTGREINPQVVMTLLWLSSHKAISLGRLIMPITETEKTNCPYPLVTSGWGIYHLMTYSESAGDWRLPFASGKRWNTSKAECCVSTVCVWSCATPGLGPRQMLANTAPHVHHSPQLDLERQQVIHKNGYSPQTWTCSLG